MNKTQKALELAIDTLKHCLLHIDERYTGDIHKVNLTIQTCKKALEQQAEPVGFVDEADEGIFGDVQNGIAEGRCNVGDYLYTAPHDQTAEIERLKERQDRILEALNVIRNPESSELDKKLACQDANVIIKEIEAENVTASNT